MVMAQPTGTMNEASSQDRLLCEKSAARFLGLSIRTLQAWRHRSVGPSYVRAGRAIRYRLQDLTSWIVSNTVSVGERCRPADGAGPRDDCHRHAAGFHTGPLGGAKQ